MGLLVQKRTKGSVVGEGLHNHGLLWNEFDNGSITRLDKLRVVLKLLAGTTVDLLNELLELAGNVSGVAIQHRGVALVDLTRVVQDDDLWTHSSLETCLSHLHQNPQIFAQGHYTNLSVEAVSSLGWVVLAVTSHVSTTDFLDGNVLDVETDIVTGNGLGQRLVVHLHRLDLSGQVGGSKGDHHAGLEHTSLNTTDGDSSNT